MRRNWDHQRDLHAATCFSFWCIHGESQLYWIGQIISSTFLGWKYFDMLQLSRIVPYGIRHFFRVDLPQLLCSNIFLRSYDCDCLLRDKHNKRSTGNVENSQHNHERSHRVPKGWVCSFYHDDSVEKFKHRELSLQDQLECFHYGELSRQIFVIILID